MRADRKTLTDPLQDLRGPRWAARWSALALLALSLPGCDAGQAGEAALDAAGRVDAASVDARADAASSVDASGVDAASVDARADAASSVDAAGDLALVVDAVTPGPDLSRDALRPQDARPDAEPLLEAGIDAGADAAPEGDAAPDAGRLAAPVEWVLRRAEAVSGLRNQVLADSAGRPLLVSAHGGARVHAFDAAGALRWSFALRGFRTREPHVALGPDDTLYLLFDFEHVDLAGERIEARGGRDIGLLALSDEGELLWHETWGTDDQEHALGLAVDAEGRLHLAGSGGDGELRIGGAPIEGWPRFGEGLAWLPATFVVVLDADRVQRWSRATGQEMQLQAVGAAADDTTYVAGVLRAEVDLGSGPSGVPEDGADLFFAAFDAEGRNTWIQRIDAPGAGSPLSLGVDTEGRLYATAHLTGSRITASGFPALTEGAPSLLAFDGAGGLRFRRSWPVHALWMNQRVDDRILLGGHIRLGGLRFGDTELPAVGGHDAFVAALDLEGEPLWAVGIADRNEETVTALAEGGAAGVYAAGLVEGEADYGPGPVPPESAVDAFLLRLDR